MKMYYAFTNSALMFARRIYVFNRITFPFVLFLQRNRHLSLYSSFSKEVNLIYEQTLRFTNYIRGRPLNQKEIFHLQKLAFATEGDTKKNSFQDKYKRLSDFIRINDFYFMLAWICVPNLANVSTAKTVKNNTNKMLKVVISQCYIEVTTNLKS